MNIIFSYLCELKCCFYSSKNGKENLTKKLPKTGHDRGPLSADEKLTQTSRSRPI